jgi:hypothetical protein
LAPTFYDSIDFDEVVKSQKSASIVIPAKDEIHSFQLLKDSGSKPAPDPGSSPGQALIRGPA